MSIFSRFFKTKSVLVFSTSHLVFSALVNLLESADYMVSLKAMDALLLVCALPDEEAAANAAEGTDLAEVVGTRLAALYDAIPQVACFIESDAQ